MIIRSPQNALIRRAQALQEPRTRRDEGLVLLEGRKAITDALSAGATIEDALAVEGFQGEPIRVLERAKVPIHEVAAALFAKVAATETAQGIAALAREPRADLDALLSAKGEAPVAVLDRIQDPGNLGAMLRTAAALGFRGALLLSGTADAFSPKVVRASAATLFRLPIAAALEPGAALEKLKACGFTVVGAAEGGEPPDKVLCAAKRPVALIVGNEGRGIAPEILARCPRKVWIPLAREVESLNAAAAFAILAYALTRG